MLWQTGQLESLVMALDDKEEEQMKNMLKRVDIIAQVSEWSSVISMLELSELWSPVFQYGKEKDVRVMIDAEQTYFQPAINRLCMEMMRSYNKEKPMIFNTYQCYLKVIISWHYDAPLHLGLESLNHNATVSYGICRMLTTPSPWTWLSQGEKSSILEPNSCGELT